MSPRTDFCFAYDAGTFILRCGFKKVVFSPNLEPLNTELVLRQGSWSNAQITALGTFRGRFVGISPKIQSHIYRGWPAVHITNGQNIATMTRSRPMAPPWP